jgi:putative membrane protein
MSDSSLGVAVPDTRLHPIYLVIGTATTLRQAIPFLVVTIFGGAPWWVNVALFGLVMVIAIARWHVKKYSVVGGVFQLRSGLVNRSVRVVPVTRITALAAFQSLTQRLVGVWGLNVQSPGDSHGSAVTLECLSGRRLDELRAALESGDQEALPADPKQAHGQGLGPSTIQRYLAWRRTEVASSPIHGQQVIAVLTTAEMLIAAVTGSSVSLIIVAVLVVWSRFSTYVPARASEFMTEIVEPQGALAVVITLVAVAIAAGVVLGAVRLNRFTLVRDGNVLRNRRGLLGKQTAAIPVERVQAVRVVEGFWRMLLGYCSLQVEVAGIGRANVNQRMLFPLVRTDRVESLVRRALPELPWPNQPLLALPTRVHRRYLTVPLGYAASFTVLALFLPGWWELLAVLPVPLGFVLGAARAREARWQVDDQSVVLRWRRLLNRNTVIARRHGPQLTELSSSPWKARAGVAGFTMRFSSGRGACIRYMVDADALLLLHGVGRGGAAPNSSTGNRLDRPDSPSATRSIR